MKKFLYLIAAGCLLASGLSAQDLSKKYDVTMGMWDSLSTDKDDLQKFVESKFNVNLSTVPMNWDNFHEKVRLWAASGQLPDIFASDIELSADLKQYIAQGVVRALPTDLSAYPNVKAYMGQADVKPLVQPDGKYYVFPRATFPDSALWAQGRGLIVRADWLKKVGITKLPETYDEYTAMLKAFVEKDPDGNGKNDTAGLSLKAPNLIPALFLGSEPTVADQAWVKENGKWVPGFASKSMEVGLKQIDKLIQDGLIDKDFYLMKTFDGVEKFAQGKTGALLTQVGPGQLKGLSDAWKKYNKTPFLDNVVLMQFWKAPNGKRYYFNQSTWWSSTYFAKSMDDGKMARILTMYDWLLSSEGQKVLTMGIEGKDWKTVDGKDVILRAKNADGSMDPLGKVYPSVLPISYLASWGATGYELTPSNIANYGEDNIRFAKADLDKTLKTMTATPEDWTVNFTSTPNKDKFSGEFYVNDLVKALLDGGDPVTAWHKVLDGYRLKGLDKAIDELNKVVK